MSSTAAAHSPPFWPARGWLAGPAVRLELTLGIVRLLLALLTITTITSMRVDAPAAVPAHLAVVAVALGSLLLVPATHRTDRLDQLGLVLTLGTLVFYVGYTLALHQTHGAGTALGLLALLEAPVRYGPRGMLLSVPAVMGVALTHPQYDASGYAPSAQTSLLLCVSLLTATLLLREAALRSSGAWLSAREQLAEAMLHLPLGVALVGPDGTVLQANPALAAMLGARDPGVLLGRSLCEQLPPAAPDSPALRASGSGAGIEECSGEYATADGRWLSVGSSEVRLTGAGARSWVFHVEDVTARRHERDDLVREARHDALTGLLSRAAGTQALTEALRSHPHTAVLFLDIDGFKQLNDTAGHTVGDAVLRRAAARVRGTLRATEAAVRWGGDEIVVLCRDVDDDAVLAALAGRLLQTMREPFAVQELGTVSVTVSIGGARAVQGTRVEEVVHAADAAMYRAKRAGGDRYALGDEPAPSHELASSAELASSLEPEPAALPAPRPDLDGERSPT